MIEITPIGFVHSDLRYRYETPRQGILAGDRISTIELIPNMNFEQALTGLGGIERIWVIYQFHLNPNWKPMVNPPRHTRNKVGVFATRSPHRPNAIGMSCVKLIKTEGLTLYISNSDILDGSPVLDIKPYLPYSDSFPDAATGWVKSDLESIYCIEFGERAAKQAAWLLDEAGINLSSFIRLQLEFNPADDSRKRISKTDTDSGVIYTLAYRTWRADYTADPEAKEVKVSRIYSGYTEEELADLSFDKYGDKQLHINFNKIIF